MDVQLTDGSRPTLAYREVAARVGAGNATRGVGCALGATQLRLGRNPCGAVPWCAHDGRQARRILGHRRHRNEAPPGASEVRCDRSM
jgi:hypothetical protein